MTVLVLERVIEYARRSFTVLVVLVVVLVARRSFTVLVIVLVVVLVSRLYNSPTNSLSDEKTLNRSHKLVSRFFKPNNVCIIIIVQISVLFPPTIQNAL